jgi:hypothetical protein
LILAIAANAARDSRAAAEAPAAATDSGYEVVSRGCLACVPSGLPVYNVRPSYLHPLCLAVPTEAFVAAQWRDVDGAAADC